LKSNREEVQAFIAEIKVAKKTQSPAVVQVFGVCVIDELLFLVLELCSEGSLLSWLRDPNRGLVAKEAMLTKLAHECALAVVFLQRHCKKKNEKEGKIIIFWILFPFCSDFA